MAADKLQLQVILSVLEKATAPLKRIQGGSLGAARALKEARDRLKDLNTQQKDVSAWRTQRAAAEQAAEAIQANRTRVSTLSREIAGHEQAIRPLQASYDALSGESTELAAKHKALYQQLRQTREQARSANQTWQENRARIRQLGEQLAKTAQPTKKLQDEYTALTAKQREQLELVRRLSGDQKELQQRHQASATSTREQKTRLAELAEQLREARAPMQALNQQVRAGMREGAQLKQQHQQQQVQLQGLRGKLNAAGISTRNLSQGERDLKAKIAATTSAISQQEDRLKRLTVQQKRLAAAKAQYQGAQGMAGNMAATGASSVAAGVAVGAPVLGAVKSYMAFEDSMLGVAKQVEGARDANGQLTATYYEMGDAIKAMGDKIPMVTTDIAALVEGGARMGIQGKDNLLEFARVAANASTAFELPADQLGEDLARISNLYKLPIKDINQLGDAINYLDDNAQSKGADIIDVMQRTAGITASVGMSFKDAAALGSTFLTLGASAEVAGTATNAMIRELAIAPQQPKRFQKGLKAIGLEAAAIQSGMAKNATGTLQQVLDTINKLPKDQQLSVTTQLFGKEFGDDAAKLANNISEYRRQLDLANTDKGSGSMQREADIRAEAMSARLITAQNRLFSLSSSLGETLRPTLVGLLEGFNNIVASVSAWVKANPELAGQIIKTAAGVAALAVGFGTITLGLASILGPFAMFRYGMALLGIKSAGLIPMLLKLGSFALPLVAQGIMWIGRALLMNPIGLAVTAIAAAAYLIYKNWEPIKAFFLGIWAEIKAGFDGGLGGIAQLILNFSPIGLFYRAFAAVMNYFGIDMPGKFTEFGSMLMQGMVNGITAGLGRVKDAITGAGESSINWFKEKLGIHSPSRVFAGLGGFTMAGLAQGLAGGEGDVLKQIAGTAKRLTDSGAALFGMDGSGISVDNRAPISARSSASGPRSGDTYNFTINASPGMDAAAIGREVQRQLAAAQNQQQARNRGRLSDQD